MTEKHRTALPALVTADDECERDDPTANAGDAPIVVDPVETEAVKGWPTAANCRDVQFLPGTRFKLGELTVELAHCLTLERVVVTDLVSGEMRVVGRVELKPADQTVAGGGKCAVSLEGVSEEVLARATARHEALRPYIASGVLPSRDAHQLSRTLKTSIRTVRRWLQRYKQRGDLTAFMDLSPGLRRGQRSLDREVEAIVRFAVVKKLEASGNCSVRSVYEAIRGDCQAIGRAVPAESTVLARIKSLKENPEVLPTEIAQKVRDRTRLVRGSAGVTRALERVEIDHTLVDTHIVDALDREPLGRPWLTIAIDVATRAVLGFVLTLEHPSRLSVALCVRQSIFPKEPWLKSVGAMGPWPMFGRMGLIYTDNGAEFRSLSFRLGCQRHGIRNEYRPVRTPRYGGTVERLIGTFMRRMRLIPGNTYNEILEARTPHAAQKAVLTLEDLERWFSNEVTAYHHEVHRTLGMSPVMAWESAWKSAEGLILPSYPADPETVLTDLLPHQSRVVSREGILVHGLRYQSLELEPYVKPEVRHIVRIDPRDMSAVYLEREAGGHLRVPWINQDWPRLSLWEWNEIRTRDRRRGKTAHPDVVRQCLAENDRLISERAAQGKLRARRRRARATRWADDASSEASPPHEHNSTAQHRQNSFTESRPTLPLLPRTQLEVTVSSVESPVEFEVLE
jgi:putative transposase